MGLMTRTISSVEYVLGHYRGWAIGFSDLRLWNETQFGIEVAAGLCKRR
jgi:hypothetical protein